MAKPIAICSWLNAQKGVCIRDELGKGRGLSATRNFEAGDTVADCDPFVIVLRSAWAKCGARCVVCFAELHSGCPRCHACGEASWCERCDSDVAKTAHMPECGAIAMLERSLRGDSQAVDHALLAARVLRAGTLEELFSLHSPVPAGIDVADFLDMPRVSLDVSKATAMLGVAKNIPSFLPRDVANMPRRTALAKLLEMFLVMGCNVRSLHDDFREAVGAGLYLGSSLINHSCSPNVCMVYQSPGTLLQEVRAIRPIKQGEALYTSYVDPALPVWERHKQLNDGFWFICDCDACTWPSAFSKEVVKVADALGRAMPSVMRLRSEAAETETRVAEFRSLGIPVCSDPAAEKALQAALASFRTLSQGCISRSNAGEGSKAIEHDELERLASAVEALGELLHPRNITLLGLRLRLLQDAGKSGDWELVWRLRGIQTQLEDGPGKEGHKRNDAC